jgi:hypothetical protein
MAHRQFTSCVQPGDYIDLGFTFLGWVGGVSTAVALIVGLLLLPVGPAALIAAIAAVTTLLVFLNWWLNGRLICLGGVECAIGVAMGSPSSNPLKKAGDDDASMNVALAPSKVDLNQTEFNDRLPAAEQEYWDNPLQGHLLKPQDSITAIGRSYVGDEGHSHYLKAIHSEFEGSGIRNLLIWAEIILPLLILALALYFIPGGAIISFLLGLLALLLGLIAAAIGLASPLNPGDPQDVNPNIGEINARDILVLKGNWVYDSLHNGWNEIHAIHACQKIGRLEDGINWPTKIDAPEGFTDEIGLDTVDKVKTAIGAWCLAIQQAEDAEGGGNRDDPAQNWVVHPMVDGCSRDIIL